MKKTGKKIWLWILSGLAMVFGSSCHNNSVKQIRQSSSDLEEVYGPPPPEVITEPDDDTVEEPYPEMIQQQND